MMNPTMFDPIALDAWYSDENNDSLLKRNWNTIFKIIFPVFPSSHNEGCSKLLYKGF